MNCRAEWLKTLFHRFITFGMGKNFTDYKVNFKRGNSMLKKHYFYLSNLSKNHKLRLF